MKSNRRRARRWQGSLAEQAYSMIREKILRGEFPLGAALSRRKLGTQFGMSFLPISEAIQRLEHDGLVESRPRVGTRVRIPTPQDLRDRYIIREALETQSARLFAEKASSDERLELRSMAAHLDAMMERCGNGDAAPDTLFRAQTYHLSFHMRIAECTGSQALRDAIEKNQVLIFNWLYDVAVEFRLPPRWHRDLIGVVAGGDPDAAAAAMRKHVRHGLEEIQARISSHFGATGARLERTPAALKTAAEAGWRVKGGRRVSRIGGHP
jgi:DNA-binding GntR family transcriptional regulator